MTPEALLTKSVQHWQTRQAIVWDWYDGPREGMIALAVPGGEFLFHLLEERPNADGPDDRLFRLEELPAGSLEAVLTLLRPLGTPTGPIWVPVWRFPDDASRRQAEGQLHEIEQQAKATGLAVASQDLLTFQGCWPVPDAAAGAVDWITLLRSFPLPTD